MMINCKRFAVIQKRVILVRFGAVKKQKNHQ
jgi:hypothetical protein